MPTGSRRIIEVAVDDRRDLVVLHGVDRLAAVQRLERGEAVGLRLDPVGDLEQIGRALRGGRARPRRKGLLGRCDGRLDLPLVRLGQGENRRTRPRVEDRLLGLRPRLEARADQHCGVHGVLLWLSIHPGAPARGKSILRPSRLARRRRRLSLRRRAGSRLRMRTAGARHPRPALPAPHGFHPAARAPTPLFVRPEHPTSLILRCERSEPRRKHAARAPGLTCHPPPPGRRPASGRRRRGSAGR